MSIYPSFNGLKTSYTPPSIIRHLEIFHRMGSTPIIPKVGNFSRISKPVLTMLFLLNAMNLVANWWEFTHGGELTGDFMTAVIVFERVTFCIGPGLVAYRLMKNRAAHEEMMNRLIAAQCALENEKYKMFRSIKIISVLVLVITIVHFSKQIVRFSDVQHILDAVSYETFNVYRLAICFNFTYLVQVLSSCFAVMSKANFSKDVDLKKFIRLYNHLVDISTDFNWYFDASVSYLLITSFLSLIENTGWYLDKVYVDRTEKILDLSWAGVGFFSIWHMVQACQSATDESENASKALSNYLIHHRDIRADDAAFVVLHFNSKRTVSFRACSSIRINYELALSMIAAYCTYVTVLFQIDHASKSSQD